MIFVMLGTNPYPFERLLKAVSKWVSSTGEHVVAQVGHTPLRPDNIECHDFVSHKQIEDWITKAEVVITQGGFGSLRDCLVAGKPTIAVPRNPDLGECQDLQEEIVDALAEEGRVLALYDVNELPQVVVRARKLEAVQWPISKIPQIVRRAVDVAIQES